MSLIQHSFFPRSKFDMDFWSRPIGFGPSAWDMFDPFDEIDRKISRNLMWLRKPNFFFDDPDFFFNKPDFFSDHADFFNKAIKPKFNNNTYRINVDCNGYNLNSIKTETKDGKVIVSGSDGDKHDKENYTLREFKKTFQLPENAISDKLVSFVTPSGSLAIEVPLKENERQIMNKINYEAFPKVINSDNGKSVQMNVSLPNNIDPSKISVTCKDRDLIVKVEDKTQDSNGSSSFYFYNRTTLPHNTDLNALKCNYNGKSLDIKAPVIIENRLKDERKIPVHHF